MFYSKATIPSSVARYARALLVTLVCFAASVYAPAACFAASVHIEHVASTVGGGESALSSNIIAALIGLLVEALKAR